VNKDVYITLKQIGISRFFELTFSDRCSGILKACLQYMKQRWYQTTTKI